VGIKQSKHQLLATRLDLMLHQLQVQYAIFPLKESLFNLKFQALGFFLKLLAYIMVSYLKVLKVKIAQINFLILQSVQSQEIH